MEHLVDHPEAESGPVAALRGPQAEVLQPLDLVDTLERQLNKLRALCVEHVEARQRLAADAATAEAERNRLRQQAEALAGLGREVAERAAAIERREAELRDRQAALREQESALQTRERQSLEATQQREHALAEQKQALVAREEALALARDSISAREHDLGRIKAKLAGISEALRSLAADASPPIAPVAGSSAGAPAAGMRDAGAMSDVQAVVGDLQDRISRIAAERDRLQARLQRHEDRLRQAGLEIQWAEMPKSRKKRSG